MSAHLFGRARVFVVDMVDSRLELAQGLGAIPINATQTEPVEAIKQATGGFGVDSSIEAVGLLESIGTAIACVRGGGAISSGGVPNHPTGDFPDLDIWRKAVTYRRGLSQREAVV